MPGTVSSARPGSGTHGLERGMSRKNLRSQLIRGRRDSWKDLRARRTYEIMACLGVHIKHQ
jgi:hypothetical protein